MTIARPNQERAANNGRGTYQCLTPGCVPRPRFVPRLHLGLQHNSNGQQQARSWRTIGYAEVPRHLQRCRAASVAVQEAKTIKVRLCVQHQVPFGQVLKVVGSGPKLGNWQGEHGQELKWTEGHIWTGDLNLEPGCYEFKCVTGVGDTILAWEPGPNRILQVPSGVRGVRVDGTWSQTSDNRVTVTEPIAAASVAARQKRAAAAKLLAKALAEVNAVASAAGPSAAALAGRGQAAATGAGSPAAAGAAKSGVDSSDSSSSSNGGSKRSAAEALEEEALRELRELLSAESASVSVSGARSVDSGKAGGSGRVSDSELRQTLLGAVAGPTAAEGAAGGATVSPGDTRSNGKGALLGVGAGVSEVREKGSEVKAGLDSSAGEHQQQQQQPKGGEKPKGGSWRDSVPEAAAKPEQQQQEKQDTPEGGKAKGSSWRDLLSGGGTKAEQRTDDKQKPQEPEEEKAINRSWRDLLSEAGPKAEKEEEQDLGEGKKTKGSSWRDLLSGAAEESEQPQQQKQQAPAAPAASSGSSVGGIEAGLEPAPKQKQQGVAAGAAAAAGGIPESIRKAAATGGEPVTARDAAVSAGGAEGSSSGCSSGASSAAAFAPVGYGAPELGKSLPAAKPEVAPKQRPQSVAAAPAKAAPTAAAAVLTEPAKAAAPAPAAADSAKAVPVAARAAFDAAPSPASKAAAPKQEAPSPASSSSVSPPAAVQAVAAPSVSPLSVSAAPASGVQSAATKEPAKPHPEAAGASSTRDGGGVGGRFAGLLGRLGRFGDLKEAAARRDTSGIAEAKPKEKVKPEDKPKPDDEAKAKAEARNQASDVVASAAAEEIAKAAPSSTSANAVSSSSKPRGASWRQLLDDGESKVGPQQQEPASKPQAAGAVAAEEQAVKQGKAGGAQPEVKAVEEDVSSRFARLLASRLSGQGNKSGGTEAPAAEAASTAQLEAKQVQPQERPKQEAPKSKPVEAAAAPTEAEVPATPPGRDIRAPAAVADITVAASAASEGEPNGREAEKGCEAEVMGVGSSRADVETVSDPDLNRLVGAWDAAWSEGRPKQAPATATPGSSGSLGQADAASANGTGARQSGTAPLSAASGGISSNSNVLDPDGRVDSRSGARAAANGGTAGLGNGGESLYSIAERLTGSGGPAVVPPGSSDDSSPGITVRKGAMAAMGVDRQGSYDTRSSYLSQSLLADSLSGGGSGSQEQSSSALLRQLRAASAASAAAAAANGSATANGSGATSSAEPIPNLPATPAPPGILSSVDDDEDGNVAPPRLPATPPPPSYLSGPPAAAGPATAAAVPPLPATPVASSILSGNAKGAGTAADDLLRRAADADAVLNMLRGNLPLTPIARGGRGGGAGPLAMAYQDDEEDGDDDDGGDVGGGAAAGGGRGRRDRRGHRLIPLLPVPTVSADSQGAADAFAAARAAAQALDKTRAALQALQQSAASGLGLSPEALSESAARLLQQLPKLESLTGQANGSSTNGTAGPTAADGSAASGTAALGLPPAVSQLATTLVSGLGTVGSSLTGQLRKSGAAGAASAPTEAANGAAANGLAGSDASANGVENGTAIASPTAAVAAAASTAVTASSGLLSGLFSNLVGGGAATPPPGCARLVAGAHMIPHVDKVDKGGEDAYFISRVGLGGVGVADGVSGWADEGIDPAEYPRTLMRYAADAFEAARGSMSAQDIIRYAQYRTYLKGSSTVCMALMKPGKRLEVANVGDSGVRILRNGKVIFGTEAQQHAFNMPYQLSHPNNVEDPDSADDADVHIVDVQEGDVIMLATDGLFDNVFDAEIEQIVSQQLRELAATGRGRAPVAAASASAAVGGGGEAAAAASAAAGGASGSSAGSGGAGARGGKGLLSQSFAAAQGVGGGGSYSQYRPEDAARVARALAERAHLHARNPTQRTPWSVTSSQQPNFMWAKFFAKGGGKMDDCTVLIAFVCGPE